MQLGRKVVLVAASNVVGALLGYGALLVIGRAFDPAAYGSFVFASSAGGLLALATTLGLGAAHQRLVARGVPHRTVMGTAARLRLALLAAGLAVLGLAFVVLRWLRGDVLTDATSGPVLVGAVVIQVLGMTRVFLAETWIGQQKVARPEVTRLLDAFLLLVLLANAGLLLRFLAGHWSPASAVGAWWAHLLGLSAPLSPAQAALLLVACTALAKLVSLLVALVLAARDGLGLGPYDAAVAKQLWAFGLPLALTAAIGLVVQYTDVVLLGFFWTAREVGLYGTGQKLAVLAGLAAGAASGVLFSRFAQASAATDAASEGRTHREAERWLLLVSVPVAASLVALARPILHIAVGDGYLDAAPALRLLALSSLAYVIQVPLTARFMGHGMTRTPLVAGATNAVANVALNLLLVPPALLGWGPAGASAATLASNLLAWGVLSTRATRAFAAPRLPHRLLAITLAATPVALAWWQLATRWPGAVDRVWELGVVVAAGCLAYGLLLIAFGVLGRADLELVRRSIHPKALGEELVGR